MVQALSLVSAPWRLDVLTFVDERAAGFFALGRAKRDDRPVVISVTSGTAAAELLPAAIEAHATDVPLIFATADRPRNHRGSGSPQSMWQVGLYTHYAPTLLDWEEGEAFPDWSVTWDRRSPVHINLCHREPLWSKELPSTLPLPLEKKTPFEGLSIQAPFPAFKKPLVVVGALPAYEQQAAAEFCRWFGAPVLAEASSGIRETTLPNWIRCGDRSVREWWKRGEFDGVIRFGAVPSWRLWRDLENWQGEVLTFGHSAWSGLPGRQVVRGALTPWLQRWQVEGTPVVARTALLQEDHARFQRTLELMREFPLSEPALVHQLSLKASKGSVMYLGNSRPVRDWNEYAAIDRAFEIQENRGLNGIDGQVSSFLGHARAEKENWALVGDLTALYDLNGPWALRFLPKTAKLRLVVMNNHGGRIFERMFPSETFLNHHDLTFEAWAQQWGLGYTNQLQDTSERVLIELKPELAQTKAYRDQVERL